MHFLAEALSRREELTQRRVKICGVYFNSVLCASARVLFVFAIRPTFDLCASSGNQMHFLAEPLRLREVQARQ